MCAMDVSKGRLNKGRLHDMLGQQGTVPAQQLPHLFSSLSAFSARTLLLVCAGVLIGTNPRAVIQEQGGQSVQTKVL